MITFKFVEEEFLSSPDVNGLKMLIDRLKSKGNIDAYNLSVEL